MHVEAGGAMRTGTREIGDTNSGDTGNDSDEDGDDSRSWVFRLVRDG